MRKGRKNPGKDEGGKKGSWKRKREGRKDPRKG